MANASVTHKRSEVTTHNTGGAISTRLLEETINKHEPDARRKLVLTRSSSGPIIVGQAKKKRFIEPAVCIVDGKKYVRHYPGGKNNAAESSVRKNFQSLVGEVKRVAKELQASGTESFSPVEFRDACLNPDVGIRASLILSQDEKPLAPKRSHAWIVRQFFRDVYLMEKICRDAAAEFQEGKTP